MKPSPDASNQDPAGELQQTLTLLGLYAEGDLEALGELFRRYYQRVLQVVRSRIGFKLRAKLDAEDCVQQVFVDALHGLESFDYRGPGSFMNWLATIAVNRLNSERERYSANMRDVDREKALESLRGAAASSGAGYDPAADVTQVPDRVAREEESEHLMVALDKLSEEFRRAVELRWILGCTLEEVMDLMKLPNDMAAHRLCTRAREELGRSMPS